MATQIVVVGQLIAAVVGLATLAIALRNIVAALRQQPYRPVPLSLETTVRVMTWLLCPFAAYELILFFSRADLKSRIGVLVFVVLVILFTSIRRLTEKAQPASQE
jgi:hypothetical protein